MRELFERAVIAADYLITDILDKIFDAYFWVIDIPGRIGDRRAARRAARVRRRLNASGRVPFGVDCNDNPVYLDHGSELAWCGAHPNMQGIPNHQLDAYTYAFPGLELQADGRTLRPPATAADRPEVVDTSNVVAEAAGVPDREPARPDGPDFGWLHVDLADRGKRWWPKPYRAPDAPAADGNVYAGTRPNPYAGTRPNPYAQIREALPGAWHPLRNRETVDQWIARVAPDRSEAPTTMLARLHAIVGAGLPVFRQNGALSLDTPFRYQNCLELQAFVTAAGSVGYRQLVLADEPDARQIRITPGMHEDGMPSHRSITLTYERINDLHAQLYPAAAWADAELAIPPAPARGNLRVLAAQAAWRDQVVDLVEARTEQ